MTAEKFQHLMSYAVTFFKISISWNPHYISLVADPKPSCILSLAPVTKTLPV